MNKSFTISVRNSDSCWEIIEREDNWDISDPDLCTHCDVHGIIVVNGQAYQPVH